MNEDSRREDFANNQKRLPQHLQRPFAELKRQEAKIKALLATEEGQAAFRKNPVAAMEGAGVRLDAALRKALLPGRNAGKELDQKVSMIFANGGRVTPKVRVRFV